MHQLRLGLHLQLAFQQGQVVGHRLAADAQALGDLAGRQATGEHHEDLELALGDAAQARVVGLLAGQLGGQGLFDVRVAGEDAPHRLQQHFRRGALGDVARRAGIQRLAHQGQFVVHAEEQHAQLRQALA
ncbi:hypothetical protein FQZ97_643530 [compost metagenome]